MNYESMTKAELISKLKSLESDIEKSGCSEEVITPQRSEEKYHQLIESLNDSIFLVDVESGLIIEANKRAEDLLGMPVGEIVGMNRTQMYPPEYIEDYEKIFQKYVKTNGGKTTEDIFIQHKAGNKIPVEISSNIFELNNRKVLLAIFRDITQQKQVQNSLEKSEKRYHDIVRSMSDWIWEVDVQGKFTYTSGSVKNILGYDHEELLGRTPFDLMSSEEAERVAMIFTEVSASRKPIVDLESWNITKDGRDVCLLTNGVPMLDNEGRLLGYRGVDKDITSRKEAEEALHNAREDITGFANILEESLNEIYIFDAKTFRFVHVNKGASFNLGYSMEELASLTPIDLKPEFTPKLFEKMIEPLRTGKKNKIQFTTVHKRKNGSLYDVEVHLQLSNFQTVPSFLAIILDITERKQAEEVLSKYQILFDNVSDLAYICDTEGNILYLNMVFEKLSGHKPEEFIGKTFEPLFDKDNLEKSKDLYTRTLKGESPREEIYFKDTGILCEYRNQPLRDEKGVIVGVIGIGRDITKQKRTEEKIRKFNEYLEQRVLERTEALAKANKEIEGSEQRFRDLAETIPEVFWITSHDFSKMIYVSPAYETIWGRSCKSLYDEPKDWLYSIHPEDREKVSTAIEKHIKGLTGFREEYRVVRPDKSIRWILDRAFSIKRQSGSVNHIIGIAQDITARKLTEKRLAKKNAYLKLLQVTAVAANEANDINDAFLQILEQICHYTAWEIGHAYAIAEKNPDLLKPTEVWCLEEQKQFMDFCNVTKETDFARGVGLPGRVLSSGKPHWIVDVTKDSNFLRKQIALDLNIKSGVAFPVMVESSVVAVLEFFTTKCEEPDQQFMEIMSEVGTQLGRVVERKQAEINLKNNHNLLDAIIEGTNDVAFVKDLQGKYLMMNTVGANYLGMSVESIIGKDDMELFPYDIASNIMKRNRDALISEKTVEYETPVEIKDKIFTFLSKVAPYRDSDGYIIGIIGISHDITGRKNIERTLQDSEERYRSLINDVLDTSNVGTFILDKEFRVVWMNESMEFYFGLDRNDVIMKAKRQLIEDQIHHIFEDGDEFKERMLRAYDDNTYTENFVCHILPGDGREERWLEHWSQPIVSGLYVGGRVENYTDITKSKKAEKALLQSEKMKAMGIMTAGVAHEFNNILAVISSNAQLLEEVNRSDNELSRSLRTICRMTDDGAEIVDRMYDFTNVHKDTSSYESVDLNDLIKQVVGFTMPRWKEMAHANGITYDIDQQGVEKLPSVLGNPSELREVILNIINNALDAMPAGGSLTVSTRCVQSDKFGVESKKENGSKPSTQSSKLESDFLEITFADSGNGMSEEVKKMMFDPFYTTRAPQGTGLGMSISYGIITRHGGEINVESELGKGSRIFLTLPIAEKSAHHIVTPIQNEKLDISDLNVLIVDDSKEMCKSLCELFTDEGQRVFSVDNGTEAIRLLKKNNYDLLICDLVMPDVTGKEVIMAMGASNRRTKVGLLTGWEYSAEDAKKDGLKVDLIIKKPFKLSKLRRDINDIFSS